MAMDFPNSPTVGQVWPSPPVAGQPQYVWNGSAWTVQSGTVSALALISTVNANNQAQVVFNLTGYSRFKIIADGIKGATAAATFNLQVSEDGGTTWKTSSTGYVFGGLYYQMSANASTYYFLQTTQMQPFANLDLSGATGNLLDILISKGSQLSYTPIKWNAWGSGASGSYTFDGGGIWTGDTNPINAVRFFFSVGNILQGSFSLYGIAS
jgi:hypothetical protein